MSCNSLNELYKQKEDVVYLTNSLGEQGDNVIIPEAVYEWYKSYRGGSSSLLYLVKLKNQYGIMAIYEFDETTAENFFESDYKAMRNAIRKNADRIHSDNLAKQSTIYVGEETGFCKCDEIAVFIPYGTEKDIVKKILNIIDKVICEMITKN